MNGCRQELSQPLIIQAIDDVLEGIIELPKFLEILGRGQYELAKTKDDFNTALATQSQSVQESCRREIMTVMNLFDDYDSSLTHAILYANILDRKVLLEKRAEFADMISRLNREFMRFREAALAALGPSRHGGINLLISNLRHFSTGHASCEELRQNIEIQHSLAKTVLLHLEPLPSLPARNGLLSFYSDFLALLAEMQHFQSRESHEICHAFLKRLEILGERYRYVDIRSITHTFSQEPTTIPLANIVINCSRAVKSGLMDKELLLPIIRDFRDLILDVELAGDRNQRESSPDEGAHDEGDTIMEALGLFQIAAERYEDMVSFERWSDLPAVEESLTGSADLFEEALIRINDYADREGKVPCIRCGTLNESCTATCFSCGAIVPRVVKEKIPALDLVDGRDNQASSEGKLQMTANFYRLFEAADAYADETIGKEEFLGLLAEMEGLARRPSALMSNLPPPSEERDTEDVRKALGMARDFYGEAFGDFQQGLELFRDFAGSRSTASMERGKERLLQAMEHMKKVQTLLHPHVTRGL
jgi:hypothetical protein